MSIIADGKESWDVDMIQELRKEGMSLSLLQHAYKLYHAEKAIRAQSKTPTTTSTLKKQQAKAPTPNRMIYHLYNPGQDSGMSPMENFSHAIKVRNRSLGPGKATEVSSYLNVEVSKIQGQQKIFGFTCVTMTSICIECCKNPCVNMGSDGELRRGLSTR